jgi:hypothetical protein
LKFLILALLGLSPALADTPPAILPTQDVSVTYSVAAPGRPDAQYQLEYDSADRLARINDPAHGTFFLVNLPAGTAQMVVPALHSVVNAPDLSNLTQQINSASTARFTPLGPGNYAGTACEKYLVLNAQGSGTACLTPDGVVLHFTGQDSRGSATVTAITIAYGAQPSADFTLPPGFSSITLPPGMIQQLLNPPQ